MDRPLSLSLFGQKLGRKQRAERRPLCPVFGSRGGAQVALQRGPILPTSVKSVPCLFLTLAKGDISTLSI
jgi:hypothetical protein